MWAHKKKLSGANLYLEVKKDVTISGKEEEFKNLIKLFKKFKTVDGNTKLFELGSGIGWFLIHCKKNGLDCKGLELSAQLIDYARRLGRDNGVEISMIQGNIESVNLGSELYDIIVARYVFEHVEHWQAAIKKVFDMLKPGGMFYFTSTNKFCPICGECYIPFYGWLPNKWRYRLRVFLQGESVMSFGIDFNQFTYFKLRRFFKEVGFSKVLDPVDIYNPAALNTPTIPKRVLLTVLRKSKFLRHAALCVARSTFFICIK